MKTTLLSITMTIILFFACDTYAQNVKHKYSSKGTWEFGGDIFFTSTTTDFTDDYPGHQLNETYTETDFAINGEAGYFIIDGLKLGVEPGIENVSSGSMISYTQLRLYFTPEYVIKTKSILYPYFGGAVGYTALSQEGASSSQTGFSWGAKLGLKINVAGNSLLDIGFRYYEEQYNATFQDHSYNPPVSYDVKNKIKPLGLSLGWSVFF